MPPQQPSLHLRLIPKPATAKGDRIRSLAQMNHLGMNEMGPGRLTAVSVHSPNSQCLLIFGWQNNAPPPPKTSASLIPRTYDYVTAPDKRGFAHRTQLRILKWGDYLGLLRWVQDSTRVIRRKIRVREGRCEDRSRGQRREKMLHHWL